jgi:hypothetical protein
MAEIGKPRGATVGVKPAQKLAAKPSLTSALKPVAGAVATRMVGQVQISLPGEAHEPISSLSDAVIVLHGEKKIGKTSFCGEFEDPFFLSFEPGTKGLRVKSVDVVSWAVFLGYLDLLKKNLKYSRTVIVDTVDIAYHLCSAHVCNNLGIDHPGEAAFGKGWQAVEAEFTLRMNSLQQLGRGVVFISHTESKEFTSLHRGTFHKMVPSMSTQARRYFTGTADIIAYYGYYGKDRYLTLRGSDDLEAGSRLRERFRTKSGEPIHSIPMGNSSEEAFANLMRAFNNQQESTGEPEGATGLSETPTKPGGGNNRRR